MYEVYKNTDDGEFYVLGKDTKFDNFWTSLNGKGKLGRLVYKAIFYIITGFARMTKTYKCESLELNF